jgi:hypothetical protein
MRPFNVDAFNGIISEAEKSAFIAGWNAGCNDGGEHDCRMFEPTEERALRDYVRARIKAKHGETVAVKWTRATDSATRHKPGCPWVEMTGAQLCTCR